LIDFEASTASDCAGRSGTLKTEHGDVPTPLFMPVGTAGTVKGLTPEQLSSAGVKMLLANTYHLHLRPGEGCIESLGGLHRFMAWDGPVLTDSGGYQVFSLGKNVKVDEAGAVFRSHIDGSKVHFTPESVARTQRALGVDVAMVFDVVTGNGSDRQAAEAAAGRTLRWAARSREVPIDDRPAATFGIMQGGLFEDIRRENAAGLLDLDFPGYAVGGLSVGEEREKTMHMAEYSVGLLPADKPRYMMGMGTPEQLVALCGMGYDMFDCVLPTRNACNCTLFTSRGIVAIRNSRYANDPDPVDPRCSCYTCSNFSAAYLNHLAKRREMLGATLASLHNVAFYQNLVEEIRGALAAGTYAKFAENFFARYRGEK